MLDLSSGTSYNFVPLEPARLRALFPSAPVNIDWEFGNHWVPTNRPQYI